jgi:hypothetical protein
MSKLKGADDLRRRLNSLKKAYKPIGRKWGRASINAGRPMVPVLTGRLRRSMRIISATEKRTKVGAYYTAYFVDKGPKPHTITAKKARGLVFQGRRGTVFTRQVHHRGYRGRPFRKRMAEEGLRQTPMAQEIVDAWNKAA